MHIITAKMIMHVCYMKNYICEASIDDDSLTAMVV